MFTLDRSWQNALGNHVAAKALAGPKQFLATEGAAKRQFYPKAKNVLRAFELTPFDNVKVVILGQDPYHGQDQDGHDQADGLAFSVPDGVGLPPSLRNIFAELKRDLGHPPRARDNLELWASQGVLLLNTILTVAEGQPRSHRGNGWERFTDLCLEALSNEHDGLVFLLWGCHACAKTELINRCRHHHVLRAAHPVARRSVMRAFRGCGHFSEANEFLEGQGKTRIDW